MKINKIEEMVGGWFIGDFEPSVLKTKDFEVCYKFHHAGEIWDNHYHKVATEINYLIRGKMNLYYCIMNVIKQNYLLDNY